MLTIAPFYKNRNFWSDVPFYPEQNFAAAHEFAEFGDHYSLSVDLPGMKKEDIQIELVEDTLMISGERKRPGKEATIFRKNFVLPQYVNGEKIVATYEDGVLAIKLSKLPAAQPKRIEIS